jgi:hypothetical protein
VLCVCCVVLEMAGAKRMLVRQGPGLSKGAVMWAAAGRGTVFATTVQSAGANYSSLCYSLQKLVVWHGGSTRGDGHGGAGIPDLQFAAAGMTLTKVRHML